MGIRIEKYIDVDSTPIIRYVEKPVPIKRYGVDISGVLGVVNDNGVYQNPEGSGDLDLRPIRGSLSNFAFAYKFIFSNIGGDVVINISSAGEYSFTHTFMYNKGVKSFNAPLLNGVGSYSFDNVFAYSNIKEAHFDLIETIPSSASTCFSRAFAQSKLGVCSFNSLRTITAPSCFSAAFAGCKLTVNPFPNLQIVDGEYALLNAFQGNSELEEFVFDELEILDGEGILRGCFNNCRKLEVLKFPKLKFVYASYRMNMFTYMLWNCSGVEVHFPSNLESQIGSLPDVVNGFGGTDIMVLFDLPATE